MVFPPLLLSTISSFSFSLPYRIVFAKPEDLETWPNYSRIRSSGVHHFLQWLLGSFCDLPQVLFGLCTKCSVVFVSISFRRPVFFLYSDVKVHDSQVYRNMEMTRERIIVTFDPRDICRYLSILRSAF